MMVFGCRGRMLSKMLVRAGYILFLGRLYSLTNSVVLHAGVCSAATRGLIELEFI